ncbi:MAG: gas vesicle protein [Chloroherpetonaceae bacterium]|nr:gas vesicle protein [Chloroherpetonaceae bacterium]MDW8438216.1 gas vesicle protein [Chloroherpetonaceae bacterium]
MDAPIPTHQRNVTLLELLDRVLDKGVFVSGDITLSVAGVDLIVIDLRALICSQETFNRIKAKYEPPRLREPNDSNSP